MDADQRGRGVDVAHHESDGFLALSGRAGTAGRALRRIRAFESKNAEASPAGREVGIGDFADRGEGHVAIIKGLRSALPAAARRFFADRGASGAIG